MLPEDASKSGVWAKGERATQIVRTKAKAVAPTMINPFLLLLQHVFRDRLPDRSRSCVIHGNTVILRDISPPLVMFQAMCYVRRLAGIAAELCMESTHTS